MDTRVLEFVKAKAAEKTNYEADSDFSIYDASGGNFDEAHSLGIDDGEIYFARSILKMINGGVDA